MPPVSTVVEAGELSAAPDAAGPEPVVSDLLPRPEVLRVLTAAAERASNGLDRRLLSAYEGDILALSLRASEVRVSAY